MTASAYFKELSEKFEDVKPGKMFGCDCLKTPNGKAAAMFWHDHLVVKLPPAELEKALKIKGSKIFEPMKGRPMNGWLQVPFSNKESWEAYLKQSIGLVKLIPAKKTKNKK